ncbi:MAG: tyrosine-type recombinase/integrase [Pseudomonadota bacterium]
MSTKRITDKLLAKDHKLDTERIEIWDAALPGFGVRITAKGRKSFFVMTRLHGRRTRVTLGTYPRLSLAEAREAARQALQAADAGHDPRAAKAASTTRLETALEEFEARHLSKLKPSSVRSVKGLLWGRFLDRFKARTLDTIRRGEIQALLDDIADEGKATTANRMLASVRKFFNWSVKRGLLEVSPCAGIEAPAKENQRDRFLSMAELAQLWEACETLSPVASAFVRILAVTGQRRGSVASMRRSQITDGVWTIPADNMKGSRAHTVPLPPMALDILANLPVINDSDLVFTHDGRREVSGFSKLKAQLDRACEIFDWRLHDLRRTAGTHIARLGFPRLTISKILGHRESGVTQIYELHSYDTEKRRALEAWAAEIEAAVTGQASPSNVIQLKG